MFSPDDSDMYGFALADRERLEKVLEVLENAPRRGAETDEPEGARYIQISDTLANELSASVKIGIKRIRP